MTGMLYRSLIMIKYTIVVIVLITAVVAYKYYYHQYDDEEIIMPKKRVKFSQPEAIYEKGNYSVEYTRDWSGKQSESTISIIDSVLDMVVNMRGARDIVFRNGVYIPVGKDVIKLEKNIYFRLVRVEGDVDSITFRLESKMVSVSGILSWVENLVERYKVRSHNKLGNRRYFFDECQGGKNKARLEFSMTRFHTNKSMDTVYGKDTDRVRKSLDLFLHNPEWYEERGIPHTLGLLLHGQPGCGKTSTIKAIANDSNRHIINLKLSEKTRKDQLRNLFFDEKIVVPLGDNNYDTFIIPQSERLYVIEDIDCLTNVVFDREFQTKPSDEDDELLKQFTMTGNDPTEYKPMDTKGNMETDDKSVFIDLGFILNLLDGVLEIPSRLIVITTNYPEKLDKALIRPGRMDVVLEYGPLDAVVAKQMIERFYGVELDGELQTGRQYTAAELTQMMCQCHDSIESLFGLLMQN